MKQDVTSVDRTKMKSLGCRSLLIALTSLLLISGCPADEQVVLSSATAGHDERTGKPVLKLIFSQRHQDATPRLDPRAADPANHIPLRCCAGSRRPVVRPVLHSS